MSESYDPSNDPNLPEEYDAGVVEEGTEFEAPETPRRRCRTHRRTGRGGCRSECGPGCGSVLRKISEGLDPALVDRLGIDLIGLVNLFDDPGVDAKIGEDRARRSRLVEAALRWRCPSGVRGACGVVL